MITAGVDIGSVAAKAVIVDRDTNTIIGHAVLPTGWNPRQAFTDCLGAAAKRAGVAISAIHKANAVTATGYGRVMLKNETSVLSEITCHAAGARFHFPEADGVVDIGGQDSKAIRFSPDGAVEDFVMNDKCAAGTGRFIQMTATILGMDLNAFSAAAAKGKPAAISSMCAVFAESEIVGLLARETPPQDIAAGVVLSIAERTAGMSRRLALRGPCVFSGGLAASCAMADRLSFVLGRKVLVPPQPQLTGALGAALLT
ncbi:acyl-CoA dehydratase activase [Desulfovibrio sp. OttesenSCG-928-G15]|nr:acyl-CoA dehydratase activase [Desulfovibrio sp. OttesenSCG-928-G15]